MSSHRFARAFTVLELLIVLAIFGLLATLAVLSLNSSRARMRDSQRVSDVSLMQSGLSRFWLEQASYPVSAGVNLSQPGQNADALTSAGFVPASGATAPVYIEAGRMPVGPGSNEYYHYQGDANGYALRFMTETATVYGQPGVYYAHASGIDTSADTK